MNTFTRILLLSALLLLLASCNDAATGTPLPDPGASAIPPDAGQTPPTQTGGNNNAGNTGGSTGGGNTGGGSGGGNGGGNPSAPVPEPGTLLLVGTGLALFATHRRRKNGIAEDDGE